MSKKKSVYIAGPMTGYPNFNFDAFYAAEKELKEAGWIVYNPANKEDEDALDPEAKVDGDTRKAIDAGFDFRKVYLWDVEKVIMADAIYMLPGWEKSVGACGELAVAMAVQKHYPDYEIFMEATNVPEPA